MIMASQQMKIKIGNKIRGIRPGSEEYQRSIAAALSIRPGSEKFRKSKPIVRRRRNHDESSQQEEVEGDEINEWMVNDNKNKKRGNHKEAVDEPDKPRNNYHILWRKTNNNNCIRSSTRRNHNNYDNINGSSTTTTRNKSPLSGRKRKLSECITITTPSSMITIPLSLNNNKNNKRRKLKSIAEIKESCLVQNTSYNPRLASNLSVCCLYLFTKSLICRFFFFLVAD